MKNWIKRLIASYDKLFYDETKKKKPTIYRIGKNDSLGKKFIVGKKRNFMPYVGGVANYKNICDEIIESDYKGFEFS